VEVNHGQHLEVHLENLVMTGACLSSNEERVVLYDSSRDSRDCAGLVMRGDDRIPERKSLVLIELYNYVNFVT